MSGTNEFRNAIQSVGLSPPDVIEPGILHRFPGAGKNNGNTAGWCKLFDDGKGGVFGDWSSDLTETWQAKLDKPYTSQEREAFRKRCEQERREREAEKQRVMDEAAERAKEQWKAAKPEIGAHRYLLAKGIKAHSIRTNGNQLIIPMRSNGEIHSLQFIGPDGDKKFLFGGQVKGCYFSIGKPDSTLCVCEGFATGASINEATGYAVAVAFNAGNLEPVAKVMRDKFPDIKLILCADDDRETDGNPGITKATQAAQAVNGSLAVPVFSDGSGTDFNDLAKREGFEALKRCIDVAIVTDTKITTDDDVINELAALSPMEYDRVRKEKAKELQIQVKTLDKLVAVARKDESENGLDVEDVEPWPDPIIPAELLDSISNTIRRFIICEAETAYAVALWAVMTWVIDVIQVAPLAVITAPEKRCGKSQLLFLLGRLTYRPLTASNISPAALFRAIDAWKPTLLVDEADAFMRENEELRGLLNCGHTRDSAYVVRVMGDDHKPVKFNVWGAKALAGIGKMADTIMDRSITLQLRRKLPHENVDRLRYAEANLFDDLASKLARFADDYREAVRKARPNLPQSLNDRAQDNWEPLLAIADIAGDDWPDLARKAAIRLSEADAGQSIGVELLTDIKHIFDSKHIERITTAELIGALCSDEEMPWATYYRGKPISPRQISRRLGEYGISSKNLKLGYADVKKGYERSQFDEAFTRYVTSPFPPENHPLPLQPTAGVGFKVADKEQVAATTSVSATTKPLQDKVGSGVADKKGGIGARNIEVNV